MCIIKPGECEDGLPGLILGKEENMAGSIFGKHFAVSTWGESHGKGLGVVIDGCPAGLPLSEADIQKYLDRRKPGQSQFTTSRKEGDRAEILSGVFEGRTTGTPISILVANTAQRSQDYSEIASYYRPGHADYTFDMKYGFRDYRGGGRSSGRETIGRVAAGAVAAKILGEIGIRICTYTRAIGPVEMDVARFDADEIRNNAFYMPDAEAAKKAADYTRKCMEEQDSVGGIIECVVTGLPAGLGEPCFDKLDANLAKAILSIGAVKGFELGDGFGVTKAKGTENNDAFVNRGNGIEKVTNHAGGVLGGISDGSPLVFRAAVKPTPSVAALQHTVNKADENIEISIKGRHDPVVVPRAVVVVEAMTALTLVDALFEGMSAKMDYIQRIWGR